MILRNIGQIFNAYKRNLITSSVQRAQLFNAGRFGSNGIHAAFGQQSQKHVSFLLTRRNFHSSSNMASNQKEPPKGNKDGNKKDFPVLVFGLLNIFVICFIYYLMRMTKTNDRVKISWFEFVNFLLNKGEVEEIIVYSARKTAVVRLLPGAVVPNKMVNKFICMDIENAEDFDDKVRSAESSLGIPPDKGIPIHFKRSSLFEQAFPLLFLLACIFIFRRFMKNSPISSEAMKRDLFSFGKAKFTMIDPHMPGPKRGVKLSEVAGAKEAKQEVMEFVDFLKNPQRYKRLGAKVPKGALLLGPPGCGKTLLAKAVATEGKVPFLSMNGPEFVEVFGGLGAARVRDLFKEARKRSPCIVYIDELDAIGRKRSSRITSGMNSEEEQTLNQLLVEMDGLISREGVIILSSTNRVDVLDDALLRPGRFDRHITMDLPTLDERREIYEHHLKKIVLENSVETYSKRLASLSLGFSGADIANVCNEAALLAARNKMKMITGKTLEYAIEKVIAGTEKKSQAISPEERKVVAYHESGHALVGWLLEHTDALLKVTIIPRTSQALGFAQYMPQEKKLYVKEEIDEKMCMALGGRVAESLTFNRITTGAQNDLEKVTKMAYAQVRTFGFSDQVGQVSFPEEEQRTVGKRPYSNKLASIMDEEVNRIIFEAYKKTEDILSRNKDMLKTLAEELLKRETLNYEDVVKLIGPPRYNKNLVEPYQFEQEVNSWDDLKKS